MTDNHSETDPTEDTAAFEANVQAVYDQAFESGVQAFEAIHRHREILSLSEWIEFQSSVNAGYARAQELIVKELKSRERAHLGTGLEI